MGVKASFGLAIKSPCVVVYLVLENWIIPKRSLFLLIYGVNYLNLMIFEILETRLNFKI